VLQQTKVTGKPPQPLCGKPSVPSRDFVPWRFSDAGHRSAQLDRRRRHPKTCTRSAISYPPGYSTTSSGSASRSEHDGDRALFRRGGLSAILLVDDGLHPLARHFE
jgi:hypothetical protein